METHEIPAESDIEDLVTAEILSLAINRTPSRAKGWRTLDELYEAALKHQPELVRNTFQRRLGNQVAAGELERQKVGKVAYYRMRTKKVENDTIGEK